MNSARISMMVLGFALAAPVFAAGMETGGSSSDTKAESGANEPTPAERADRRYQEMLNRMQASIEEIAQLYGNPVFLQVFTNDVERASELKQRLRAAKSSDEIAKELQALEHRRNELQDDIALKEREAARLTRKLSAQRAALDAVSGALEQARRAVEDTSKESKP
jgi:chromosome segregation ATPase